MTIKTKRAYDVAATKDGQRILVDRIWPRGVSKEEAKVHEWLKSIGPSHELRKWFNHDEEKYDTFKEEYKQELKSGEQKEALDKLKEIAHNNNTVTLIFGAKEETYNQATVLKEILEKDE